ncbi:MAG TPA: hypothetical protein VFN01_11320 [Marinobacter sp.]|uniref:hypothetical protein n=1 Tax=Marinobacter sp. TaxID=50741 RepID=UPI002D7FFF1B|nr:hypothetical protein [Marinobacter sp.]HET8801761.1 hypothetical protein [Marinobacter sp.]
MIGNIIVNAVLAGILFAAYSWTPWASLVLASLSALAFSHIFIFDRAFLEEIAKQGVDKLSLLIGAGVSYVGVIVSIVALLVLR